MKLEGLPTSFYFHLDHIQKKGYEMNALLKSLSSFSQVAFEPLQRDHVSLQKVLTDVIDSLRLETDFASVQFSLGCDGETNFYSDKNKLFLLMRNVVKNALDFRSIDRVCKILITVHGSKTHMTFQCVDNGIGIEEGVQSKIFNMFYRGSDRSTGSGLGLYVVNEIVTRLNGSIRMKSVPCETSFFISIPFMEIAEL